MSNPHRQILRMPDLIAKVGMSRPTIDRLARAGAFPKPIPLGKGTRALGWFEHEIDAWLDERAAVSRFEE